MSNDGKIDDQMPPAEPQAASDTARMRKDSPLHNPWGWVKLRFGLGPILEHFIFHRVPKRVPWYFSAGEALLLLFFVLLGTGIFLALGYAPTPEDSHRSVESITLEQKLGWYIRGLHYWSAGLMVVLIVYHMLRQVLVGGYQPPKEGTWLVGVLLFCLTIITSVIGYTLRWDERALYGLTVALTMLNYIPVIGDELVRIVLGGEAFNDLTLRRLYALHVLFIPLFLCGAIFYHIYLVVLHGVTTYEERKRDDIDTAHEQIKLHERLTESEKTGQDFFPYQAVKVTTFGLGAFLTALLLTIFLGPPELYPPANFTEDSIPQEEWWLYWYSALIAYLPPSIAPAFYVLMPLCVVSLLILLPFLDEKGNRGARRRPLAVASVVAVIVSLVWLTGIRISSPWMSWPRGELAALPKGTQLTAGTSKGHVLFTQFGCINCHPLGERGTGVGPNLAGYKFRLSPSELENYILSPPDGVAMPPYRGRMTPQELKSTVEFVLVAQTFPRKY